MHRPASARRRISPASCSSRWPASTSCMCRYREANSALNAVVSGVGADDVLDRLDGAVADRRRHRARPRRHVAQALAARSRPAGDRANAGLAGFEVIGWNGFVAPRGTPAADRRQAQRRAASAGSTTPSCASKLAAAGYEPAAPQHARAVRRRSSGPTPRSGSIWSRART